MEIISFEGQVAIVTGSGGGLGRLYAIDLARRGAKVVVNDLGGPARGGGGSPSMADKVVAEIRAAGGTAIANYDSVCTPKSGDAIVQTALDNFGRVDIVIGNAGNLRSAALDEITEEDWDSLHSTHLKGQFNVLKPAYKTMKGQGYGRILCVSSSAGLFGHECQVAYGSAKAGVVGLMHSLSIEARQYGILVNTLLPTASTRMAAEMDPRAMVSFADVPPEFFALAMDPSFNVPLATYLVSDKNKTTNGIYTSASGRYARVFIGVTGGWQGPREQPASAEDVLTHIEDIESRATVTEFQHVTDEFKLIAENLKRRV